MSQVVFCTRILQDGHMRNTYIAKIVELEILFLKTYRFFDTSVP